MLLPSQGREDLVIGWRHKSERPRLRTKAVMSRWGVKRGEGERERAECQTTQYRREDQRTHEESTKETHSNLDHVSGLPPCAGPRLRCVRIPVSTEGINMVASPGCEECAVFTCPRLTGAGFGPTIPHMNGPLEFGLQ